jgi:tetratricopeptide (TPR) repeat protein
MSRTWSLAVVFLIALILAIPAGVLGRRAYTHSTSYLLAQGDAAAEEGRLDDVDRLVKLLEKKDEMQAAHLLRGENWLYLGIVASRVPPAPPRFEQLQETAQMVLGAANLGLQPMLNRPALWVAASLYQKPARVSSPAQRLFRQSLEELAKIQDDGAIGVKGTLLAAECLIRLQEQRLAEEGLKALLKRHPDNKEAHRFLAVIYIDLNSSEEAIEHLQEWARLDPATGIPYRWIGFFKKDNNQIGDAIAAYEKALQRQLPPAIKADALKELAGLYQEEGYYEKALETLMQAPEQDPKVLAQRVACLRSIAGREQEVVQLVEQAYRDHPDQPKILVLRAQILDNEDKPELALPFLEKAIRLDPADLTALTLLITVYRKLNKEAQANEIRKQADEVSKIQANLSGLVQRANRTPWDDRVRVEIAALCLKLYRPDEARTWLNAALASNPNNARARRMLGQLPAQEKSRPPLLGS